MDFYFLSNDKSGSFFNRPGVSPLGCMYENWFVVTIYAGAISRVGVFLLERKGLHCV